MSSTIAARAPSPSRRSDWVGSGFPSPIARRETVVLPNALWGKGLGRGFARSAQLRLRVDLPHPADLRPATFSRREKGRVLTQTSGRRRRET